MMYKY